jgi:unsaturated chondroitin disaccharide hydrolase
MSRTEPEALSLLLDRVGTTLDATGDAFPYVADPTDGTWTTTPDGNWCGGHWIDALRIAADRTGADRFAEAADAHAETAADTVPPTSMFHGIYWQYAGFRAADRTGDERGRDRGIDAADAMVAAFDDRARQVPLGPFAIEGPTEFRGPASDHGPPGDRLGAVDAAYVALAPVWRAYRETGDPRYRDVAVAHCDRHLDWYVRYDGSTWHHAEFHPDTGGLVRGFNELAASDETCWARGLGWHIAGMTRAYLETAADRYRAALESAVRYYRRHAPADLVPHWDFEHPDRPDVPRDTSCAVLAADALTRLPDAAPTADLRDVGERVLGTLIADYLTPRSPADDRPRGMLLEGCFNGPSGFADRHELLWSDYYLLRTLDRRVSEAGTRPAVPDEH